MEPNETTTVPQPSKSSPEYIAAAIVIAGGLIAAAVVYTNINSAPAPTPAAPTTTQPAAAETVDPDSIVVDLEGYPSLGNPDAPILMVEYSDFSCGFCKRHNDETKQDIIEQYVDTGVVHYVRKDLITVGTALTAEAAYCAQDQDAYWEYHDVLYSKQDTDRTVWTQEATLVGYATELGLDTDAFANCLANDTHAEKVTAASQEAAGYGGSGTPFFLLNGNPVSGAQPFSAFEQAFAALLDAEG